MTLYIQKRKYFFASIKMVWQFNFFPNLKYKYIKYHHFNLYIIIIQNTRIPDVFYSCSYFPNTRLYLPPRCHKP